MTHLGGTGRVGRLSGSRLRWLFIVVAFMANPAIAGSLWSIEAEPVWGSQAEIVEPENQMASGGRYYNVVETQRRYENDAANTIYYGRYVYTINNVSGLDQSDALSLDFDPLYQKVVLHKAQILRGDHVISQLDENNIQLLQREAELENGLYNGLQTLHLLLRDQRVGDQIEYSYSIVGQNPVFAGHVFGWARLQSSVPVGSYLFKLKYPQQKNVVYRSYFNDVTAVEHSGEGYKELSWAARHTKPSRYQSDVPAGLFAQTYIQYTDFADWAQVAAWATPLYQLPAVTHAAVAARAAELKSSSNSIDQLVSAAITLYRTMFDIPGLTRYRWLQAGFTS